MNCPNRATLMNIDTVEHTVARDNEFAFAARAESPCAFAELHAIYSRRLYRTILQITKNPEDAEDALQETFLRACLAMHAFEGRSTVYTWLTRIAINSALRLLQKRRDRGEMQFDSQPENHIHAVCIEIKDPNPNPEQLYDLRQRRVTLLKAIHKLDSRLREPIQMRMANESSLKEISRRLNISEGAVKVRLYRARLRLSAVCGST
jgi:RNA polymerase sigma-70 factor (ECF subfamily)